MLKDERESRILKEKDRILKMRADEILNKGKEKGLIKVNQDDSIDDEKHQKEDGNIFFNYSKKFYQFFLFIINSKFLLFLLFS